MMTRILAALVAVLCWLLDRVLSLAPDAAPEAKPVPEADDDAAIAAAFRELRCSPDELLSWGAACHDALGCFCTIEVHASQGLLVVRPARYVSPERIASAQETLSALLPEYIDVRIETGAWS